jgi:hypothetical protein
MSFAVWPSVRNGVRHLFKDDRRHSITVDVYEAGDAAH